MDAVLDGRSNGCRDEAGSCVGDRSTGGGNFRGKCGASNCNQWGVCGVVVRKWVIYRSGGLR